MARDEKAKNTTDEIDRTLRHSPGSDDELLELAMTNYGHSYAEWYGLLLSSLTILVGESAVVYGQAKVREGKSVAVTLFTDALVIYAQADDVTAPHAAFTPRAVSRSTVQYVDITAGMPVNESERMMYEWPGFLHVTASYPGLGEPVVLQGRSFDHYSDDRVSTLWKLAEQLRKDLARSAR